MPKQCPAPIWVKRQRPNGENAVALEKIMMQAEMQRVGLVRTCPFFTLFSATNGHLSRCKPHGGPPTPTRATHHYMLGLRWFALCSAHRPVLLGNEGQHDTGPEPGPAVISKEPHDTEHGVRMSGKRKKAKYAVEKEENTRLPSIGIKPGVKVPLIWTPTTE